MKHARFVLLAVVLLLITATIWNGCETAPPVSSTAPQDEPLASVQSSPQMQEARPLFVAGEALVKFSAGATEDQRSAALQRVSGIVGERILTRAMQARGDNEGLTLVRTPMTVSAAVASLRGAAGVEYAEPNYYYYHDAVSNDPYYTNGSLWGMYGDATTPANQYGSQAGEAWAAGNTGSGSVVVGVIDEGAMYMHEDLAANFWTNPFDPVDGVDNDGNGYVDDTHGWDFDRNDNTTFDGTQDDHGTHVSGTIGAVGGNGVGANSGRQHAVPDPLTERPVETADFPGAVQWQRARSAYDLCAVPGKRQWQVRRLCGNAGDRSLALSASDALGSGGQDRPGRGIRPSRSAVGRERRAGGGGDRPSGRARAAFGAQRHRPADRA